MKKLTTKDKTVLEGRIDKGKIDAALTRWMTDIRHTRQYSIYKNPQ